MNRSIIHSSGQGHKTKARTQPNKKLVCQALTNFDTKLSPRITPTPCEKHARRVRNEMKKSIEIPPRERDREQIVRSKSEKPARINPHTHRREGYHDVHKNNKKQSKLLGLKPATSLDIRVQSPVSHRKTTSSSQRNKKDVAYEQVKYRSISKMTVSTSKTFVKEKKVKENGRGRDSKSKNKDRSSVGSRSSGSSRKHKHSHHNDQHHHHKHGKSSKNSSGSGISKCKNFICNHGKNLSSSVKKLMSSQSENKLNQGEEDGKNSKQIERRSSLTNRKRISWRDVGVIHKQNSMVLTPSSRGQGREQECGTSRLSSNSKQSPKNWARDLEIYNGTEGRNKTKRRSSLEKLFGKKSKAPKIEICCPDPEEPKKSLSKSDVLLRSSIERGHTPYFYPNAAADLGHLNLNLEVESCSSICSAPCMTPNGTYIIPKALCGSDNLSDRGSSCKYELNSECDEVHSGLGLYSENYRSDQIYDQTEKEDAYVLSHTCSNESIELALAMNQSRSQNSLYLDSDECHNVNDDLFNDNEEENNENNIEDDIFDIESKHIDHSTEQFIEYELASEMDNAAIDDTLDYDQYDRDHPLNDIDGEGDVNDW